MRKVIRSYRLLVDPVAMIAAMVLWSPFIALSVYRGTFASFRDGFRYFLYLADATNSVEVSQVALRIDRHGLSQLRHSIQNYAAPRGLIVRVDAVRSIIPDRQVLSFHLVGEAFQISIDNGCEEDAFVARFVDSDKEDWRAYRDEFVGFFAAIFGKQNVRVIE